MQTMQFGPPLPGGGGDNGGFRTGEYMTESALNGLRRLGRAVLVLTLLAFATMFAGVVSIFFFELTTTDWFSSFYTWLVIIPLLILSTVWPTLYIAHKRNLIGSTYSIFIGVYGILSILMLALMIWVLVEWFWYCPTFKPDVCTDGSSSVIETGFMIYAIVVILETIMLFAFLFVMWAMRNYFRKIESGYSTLSRERIAEEMIRAMYEGGSTYGITGFGSHLLSV